MPVTAIEWKKVLVELPDFLIKKTPKQKHILALRQLINNQKIHTVCQEASCPNIGECFSRRTCTFILLGDICTRHCRFCGIKSGTPQPPDLEEPEAIAQAAKKLGLNYLVLTSVTRDDLEDGGSDQFVKTIEALRSTDQTIKIEVLIPDFRGNTLALDKIISSHPLVLNHNIETVERLYPPVRPQAIYRRSLELLRQVKLRDSNIYTKSGFMVGLGESDEEIVAALGDLKKAGCDIITIGQYLPPSRSHPKPVRYVPPETFLQWEKIGRDLGFLKILAGPFVRSSYHAAEII